MEPAYDRDLCFYHIESGSVIIYTGRKYDFVKDSKNFLSKFKSNEYFGEYSFFTGEKRESCAIAI